MFGIKRRLYSTSIINIDAKLKGALETEGDLLINGSVEGNIKCKEITIGVNGVVNGSITAEKIIIHGMVKGNIYTSSILFGKTARVKGDIYHNYVSITTGAYIEGDLKRKTGRSSAQ
ncbi:MAG: polymer-forming cytoskeletal protein [Rickettsiales bacterium]|jgi:cytoskeletal protein CcmA (bactofilin family)|nr:polymer-forming cytoskeletal protein [Rickettsiales bacterium]